MKKWFVVILVVVAGVFLSGCTKDNVELDTEDQVENVTVIEDDDSDDVVEDESIDDSDESEDMDDTDEEEEDMNEEEDEDMDEEEDEEEEETEEETATELEGGAKTIGDATSADGAAVTAYSYGMEGGRLEFSWKVRGSDAKTYPKATATPMSDNSIVVEFESLVGDYVATEEDSMDLGSHLPELSWKPTSGGSEYTFEFDSEKTFDLTAEEIDGDPYIVLKVTL